MFLNGFRAWLGEFKWFSRVLNGFRAWGVGLGGCRHRLVRVDFIVKLLLGINRIVKAFLGCG